MPAYRNGYYREHGFHCGNKYHGRIEYWHDVYDYENGKDADDCVPYEHNIPGDKQRAIRSAKWSIRMGR